mgnify:CR=1 FL=1
MLIQSNSFGLHPEGEFNGQITKIEEDISKLYGTPQLVFTVTTTPIYGEKVERTILNWTSTSFSPKSNLGQIFMAVSGEAIESGFTLDTDRDLLHKQAIVVVEHYPKKDGQTGNRIKAWQSIS